MPKDFTGIETRDLNGSSFKECYEALEEVIEIMRTERRPFLVRCDVPLLNHHTSGVRKEWYRDDLEEAATRDPYPVLREECIEAGISEKELDQWEKEAQAFVEAQYKDALSMPDPQPEDLFNHQFAPTPITEEKGERAPTDARTHGHGGCGTFCHWSSWLSIQKPSSTAKMLAAD